MPTTNKPPPWRGIILSTNGEIIKVNIAKAVTELELIDLFYAALVELPAVPIAMELAMEKYKKHQNEPPNS